MSWYNKPIPGSAVIEEDLQEWDIENFLDLDNLVKRRRGVMFKVPYGRIGRYPDLDNLLRLIWNLDASPSGRAIWSDAYGIYVYLPREWL